MSGPAPAKRTLMMVEAYEAGATLAEVGELFGVSKQRVQLAVKKHNPNTMRPQTVTRFRSAGPPGQELYTVGTCRVCGVGLGSYRPIARDICAHCIGKVA